MTAVDLFAGPGGWDLAARDLGLDPLGVELDPAACYVREAAGLRTLQADVSALDPTDFPCDLLIASPPCTAFSMAGKGEGRKVLTELVNAKCIQKAPCLGFLVPLPPERGNASTQGEARGLPVGRTDPPHRRMSVQSVRFREPDLVTLRTGRGLG